MMEAIEIAEECFCLVENEHGQAYQESIILQVGQAVCIRGRTQKKCSRFSVNFVCGLEPQANVALHFNPRLDQNYVVRNSRVSGKWAEEETTAYSRPNIKWDEHFFLEFLPTNTEFMISINNKHFCSYSHRMPINKITALTLNGKIENVDVTTDTKTSYPSSVDVSEIMVYEDDAEIVESLSSQPIPYCGRLPDNFSYNYKIVIYGKVKLLPRSFYINLQEGYKLWPHPIIPFHINPRFLGTKDKNYLIKNAWLGGQWGHEERSTTFPFYAGKEFSLSMYVDDNQSFCVWVDDILISEFQSRAPINFDHVYIEGDIIVFDVQAEPKHLDRSKLGKTSFTQKRTFF